jgi:CobQ-like glutamine amidotransferase family enzyme
MTTMNPRSLTILSVLPNLLNTNGDAANARVLAQRARWAGQASEVVAINSVTDIPEHVDAVVIGSGTDTQLCAARDALLPLLPQLREWVTTGIPVLAVGTGWELLSWGIELPDGSVIEGLGLVAGRAVPRAERVTDEIVWDSRFGRLSGFENHARDYQGAEGSTLGKIVYGCGNGQGTEGLSMGSLIATHAHGPVLARNPRLADHLLELAFARAGVDYHVGSRAREVDEIAQAARNSIAVRLGLTTEEVDS